MGLRKYHGGANHGSMMDHTTRVYPADTNNGLQSLDFSVKTNWRGLKGTGSWVRRKFRGFTLMPNVGYGSNKKTGHYLPNSFKKFVVHNAKELEIQLYDALQDTPCEDCTHYIHEEEEGDSGARHNKIEIVTFRERKYFDVCGISREPTRARMYARSDGRISENSENHEFVSGDQMEVFSKLKWFEVWSVDRPYCEE
ncbi:hypothetical protein LguiA_018139 [Lonicera macranthoides]